MAHMLFPDILASIKVDIRDEIKKIHKFFFSDTIQIKEPFGIHVINYSIYSLCEQSFISYKHRQTILSLSEFDKKLGFDRFHTLSGIQDGEEMDYLMCFCEYCYNLVKNINFDQYEAKAKKAICVFIEHIEELCERLGYIIHDDKEIHYFVPSNSVLDVLCELGGKNISQMLRFYYHKSFQGNLLMKQQILAALYKELEPYRNSMPKYGINSITNDVFYCANNCDIRHNNTDPVGSNYKNSFAELSNYEIEEIYDKLFGCMIVLLASKIELDSINGLHDMVSRLKI